MEAVVADDVHEADSEKSLYYLGVFSVFSYYDELAFGLEDLGNELADHRVCGGPVSAFDQMVFDYVASVDDWNALVEVVLDLLLGEWVWDFFKDFVIVHSGSLLVDFCVMEEVFGRGG